MAVLLDESCLLDCPPRFATRRSRLETLGARVALVAEMLGTPLMPWQRHVADVALEIDEETGQLAYSEIVLTVPRQSGKTTLLLAVMVQRALGFGQPQRIVYTAQTRNDARKKWEDEHVRQLERSDLRAMFKVRRHYGSEAIRWHNGSMHAVTAPTEKAVHGETLDLGVIDEAFAQEDERMEQSLKPAMITRAQPQLWIVSTAGTRKSVYLRKKVDAGRLAVEAGMTCGIGYFEWSAPADADPGDPATWRDCMPAIVGGTVTVPAVRQHFQTMELDEFRRAYLNQWPNEAPAQWLVIGQQAWMALEDPRSQIADRPAFCVAVTSDRTWAAVGAAGCRADGRSHVEVVEHRRGTSWVVPWLKERVDRRDRWSPCAVVIAPSGPAGSLIAEAEAAGIEILKQSVREVAHGCASLYDAAGANPLVDTPAWLRHLGQPNLNAALAGAQRRDLGDAWLWSLKATLVDPSPLIAVTGALWGHVTKGHETVETTPEPDIF